MIPRRIEDRGGGLAKVGGRLRLLEGTGSAARGHRVQAALLQHAHDLGADRWPARGLRADSRRPPARSRTKVAAAVRSMAARVPTYVTIKDVKRRWGHGQEDVYPVAQFEKLWGDLSSLPDLSCSFLAVDRRRGQQLKDTAQLDGWANDGSMEHVQSLCEFAMRNRLGAVPSRIDEGFRHGFTRAGSRHGGGRVHRVAPGRGVARRGIRGAGGRQPRHGASLQSGPPGRAITIGSRGPRRSTTSAGGRSKA